MHQNAQDGNLKKKKMKLFLLNEKMKLFSGRNVPVFFSSSFFYSSKFLCEKKKLIFEKLFCGGD